MNNSSEYVNLTTFNSNFLNVFLITFPCVIALCSLVFNAVLVTVILCTRTLHTCTNYFILSMAASEMTGGILWVPTLAASRLTEGANISESLCVFTAMAGNLSHVTGMLTMMMISIDRCVAVWKPLKYNNIITKRSTSVMLCYVWTHGIIVCLLPFQFWSRYEYNEHVTGCYYSFAVEPNYTIVKETVSTWIPVLITSILISIMVREARSHHLIFAIATLPIAIGGVTSSTISHGRNTMKAMKALILMITSYVVFWLPFSIFTVVRASSALNIPSSLQTFLVLTSSICNIDTPVIIMVFNRKFKERFLEIFCSSCLKKSRVYPSLDNFTVSTGLLAAVESSMVIDIVKDTKQYSRRHCDTLPRAASGGNIFSRQVSKQDFRKSRSTPVFLFEVTTWMTLCTV